MFTITSPTTSAPSANLPNTSSSPPHPAILVQQMPSPTSGAAAQSATTLGPKAVSPPKHTLSPLNFTPGTRSPSSVNGSMPSSPTSIHSSSSAIFERDIEVPLSASNPIFLIHKDPHHTARAAIHEPLDSAVPTVLTAAVAALGEVHPAPAVAGPSTTATNGTSPAKDAKRGLSLDEISVIAPAPLSPLNWAANAAKHGTSRSPSPHALPLPGFQTSPTPSRIARPLPLHAAVSSGERSPIHSDAASQASVSPTTPHPASELSATRGAAPSVIGIVPPTPNVNTFGFATTPRATGSSPSPPSVTASPLVVTPPLPGPPSSFARPAGTTASRATSRPTSVALSLEELSLAPLVTTTADTIVPVPPEVEPIALSGTSHIRPPSPNASAVLASAANAASKRLSFISYNDLLNSTPVSAFPLSSVTSAPIAEPPHQVDLHVRSNHRTRTSSRQSTLNRSPVTDVFGTVSMEEAPAGLMIYSHDTGVKGGGEWEREGFGTGLEERLEAALKDHEAKDHASIAPPVSSGRSTVDVK